MRATAEDSFDMAGNLGVVCCDQENRSQLYP